MKEIKNKKQLIKCLARCLPNYFFANYKNRKIILFSGENFLINLEVIKN